MQTILLNRNKRKTFHTIHESNNPMVNMQQSNITKSCEAIAMVYLIKVHCHLENDYCFETLTQPL